MRNKIGEGVASVGLILLQILVWLVCTAFAVWVFLCGWHLFGNGFLKSALGLLLMLLTVGEVVGAVFSVFGLFVALITALFCRDR